MSVRVQRQRHEQHEHERAVLQARAAVVAAVAPAYVGRAGSSAVFEAVDEALAQIVAASDHVGDPEQVKALWITCARRRLIDELRSAESRHRDESPVEDRAGALDTPLRDDDLSRLTDAARQEWRIREILSVLRGDQRLWAEAWYDEILSGSRPGGAQPRGLGEALGWSPSKTKSVSQRARKRMATFIDDRSKGVVCDEQRVLLDAYVTSARGRRVSGFEEERYEAALLHVAGCDDCCAAWHARRRSLPVRCGAILTMPIDGLTDAAHALSAKATCLAMGVYGQAASLLGRLGIGGAAAGGGLATIGGKATAVCVGVVCAATAGGEIAGVLPPIPIEPAQEVVGPKPPESQADASPVGTSQPAGAVAPPAAAVAPVSVPPTVDPQTAEDSSQPSAGSETPGDLPSSDPSEQAPSGGGAGKTASSPPSGASSSGGADNHVGAAPRAGTSASAGKSSKTGTSGSATRSNPAPTGKNSNCVPGDLGC